MPLTPEQQAREVIDQQLTAAGWRVQDPTFLYYLLSTLRLGSMDKSTAIPGLNRNDAYDAIVPIAPTNEQRRIVAKIEKLFTRLDAGVEALKHAKRLLKRYRQSLLKSAVTGELTKKWREAHAHELEPATKLLERIAEARRQKCIEHVKESHRVFIRSRAASSTVHEKPQAVLEQCLLEFVLDDVDRKHPKLVAAIVDLFFATAQREGTFTEQVMDYVAWVRESLEALHTEGHDSKILAAQLKAWEQYIAEEPSSRGKPRRAIIAVWGATSSMTEAMRDWLSRMRFARAARSTFGRR